MIKSLLFIAVLILTASSSFAQIFGRDYNPGSFYTLDGQRHDGFLAMDFDPPGLFSNGDNTLYFKPDLDAKREKIKASTLKAFVVTNKDTARTDSFVIIHQPHESRIKYEYDFIQVINNNTAVKLYNYRLQRKMGGGFGGLTTMIGASVTYYDNYYFYGEDANHSKEMRKKDFIDIMSKMLADDAETVAKINDKNYVMGDMHKMLKAYNDKQLFAAK